MSPLSWGRWPRASQQTITFTDRFSQLPACAPLLPFGNGRSYGDVCMNEGGALLLTRGLDRFISFDIETGVLRCEAGVLLQEIIDVALPKGWFPPVTPGTSLVTVGGAIANDVHGKNHHCRGTFGNHVLEFELLRSDGQVLLCSSSENREWFRATIGGLGLTGLILTASLQLRRVPGPWIRGDSRRFSCLGEFFSLADESDNSYEYTVAWLDCTAQGSHLGRGVFIRGNHLEAKGHPSRAKVWRVPFTPPVSLINSLSLPLFNAAYFYRPAAQKRDALWSYREMLYPLDGILDWNRLYGPLGFFQYQCVLPMNEAERALAEMLRLIAASGMSSFLVVLKLLGSIPSLGMMSFARPGATLALDFPNRGAETLKLLESLDVITRTSRGAVYPAKDARMSAQSFQRFFPGWRRFTDYVDPKFSSSFWRRVTEEVA